MVDFPTSPKQCFCATLQNRQTRTLNLADFFRYFATACPLTPVYQTERLALIEMKHVGGEVCDGCDLWIDHRQ